MLLALQTVLTGAPMYAYIPCDTSPYRTLSLVTNECSALLACPWCRMDGLCMTMVMERHSSSQQEMEVHVVARGVIRLPFRGALTNYTRIDNTQANSKRRSRRRRESSRGRPLNLSRKKFSNHEDWPRLARTFLLLHYVAG
jgi:hypothetical protein